MARIDSLLSILAQQSADELQLGTDREPKMLAFGAPKRLSIPTTPEDTLRELLGEILTPDRDAAMRARGRTDVTYDAPGLGTFQVRLSARSDGGFNVAFHREARGARRAPAAIPAATPPDGPPAAPPPRDATPPVSTRDVISPHPHRHGSGATLSHRLAELAASAAALRASDLHLADGEPPVVRVDGVLRRLEDDAIDIAPLLALSAAHEERIAAGGSIDLGIDVADVGRIRVHVFRSAEGTAASIRLLQGAAPSLDTLHLPVPLDDLVALPHGLVLVCGATGSGKSTTLAALAQHALRTRSILLTTLEDPIEYGLAGGPTSVVRRRQMGRDVANFAGGLRDALREDPDVLLLGEMRDAETVGLALTAAETGHLVLSSLHCGSATSAVERIVDASSSEQRGQREHIRIQLADSLRAVVAQRLVPRARGAGRIPVLEVLRVTHAVSALIREGRTAQLSSAMQSGRKEGMMTLERSLADRVQAGEVRLEDARAVANDAASLAMYLSK